MLQLGLALHAGLCVCLLAAASQVPLHGMAFPGRWVMYVLLLVFGLWWLVRHGRGRRFRWMDAAVLVLVGYCLATCPLSPDPSLSFMRIGAFGLMYLAVFYGAGAIARMPGGRRGLTVVMHGVLAAALLAGLVPGLTAGGSFLGGRLRGVFAIPSALGSICALLLPGIAARARAGEAGARLVLPVAGLGLVLPRTRGPILAALAGCLFVAGPRLALRTPVRVGGGLWAAGLVLGAWVLMPRPWLDAGLSFLRVDRTELATLGGRVELWPQAWRSIRERPLRGYGFGVEEIVGSRAHYRIASGRFFHNSYLGLAVQAGLPVAAFFLATLVLSVLRRLREVDADDWVSRGAGGGAIAGLMLALSESWIYSPGALITYPFWVQVMLLIEGQGAVGPGAADSGSV